MNYITLARYIYMYIIIINLLVKIRNISSMQVTGNKGYKLNKAKGRGRNRIREA